MYIFDDFFASGKEESISPFLTSTARQWGRHLSLRTALISALILAIAFPLSFVSTSLSSSLLLFVYFFSGTPAVLGCIEDIKKLQINIDTLMTLAAFIAILLGSPMEGALLLVLFALSGTIEELVSKKTTHTLLSLHNLSPRTACVLKDDGSFYERTVKEIQAGTHLLIKAGEVIPLDGVVLSGRSFVNLVHLTGESQPLLKASGDTVHAGSYNLDGSLTIEVTNTSQDSTLSRIITLIKQAQEAKPTLEKFLDRFGKWYACTIIVLCALFALLLPSLFAIPYFGDEGSIYRALSFLIAASPCALIIATPTAYLSAISSCAKQGILLKGGAVLDALASCTHIAFDKTGTLTTGELHCTSFQALSASSVISEQEALRVAYALENRATHPIAKAIVTLAQERCLTPQELLYFNSIPGDGLEGSYTKGNISHKAFIGHADFIAKHLSDQTLVAIHDPQWQQEEYSHTFLLIDTSVFVFHFRDTLRAQAKPLVKKLQEQHCLTPIMLTGDHLSVANTVAAEVGITQVYAALRPEDKLSAVSALADTTGLMMIGDGINDAPALARATVGISLGKIGSATAIDASDVVLLNDDILLLDWLLLRAKKTMRIIKQNLSLALIVILFATTPALLGLIPLWLAVILHEGGTVLVGLNSLRLLKTSR